MVENQITVRPYITSDYPQVKVVLKEGGLFYDPNDSEDAMERKIKKDPNSVFVATESGLPVGTVSIMEDGRMPFVFRLAVSEKYRNRGIGASLMSKAEEELRSRGYNEITILVEENNSELKDYYKRQGYEEGHVYRWMAKEF